MITPITFRPPIRPATSDLTLRDRWDHFTARLGVDRYGHRVEPGLYALGSPSPDSPVLVTANYTLSFDTLRSHLPGTHCYILVLDTKGVNVWCAAGKGTFGTEELIRRISAVGLHEVVSHRTLIVPQLGATGVAAHEVRKRSGFRVEYGPVRAADLPEYLRTHKASPGMRQVTFPLRDRIDLIMVDLVKVLLPMFVAGIFLFLVGDILSAMGVVTAILAGVVLFPILLPWLPTSDFSTRGLILGALAALPFALSVLFSGSATALWLRVGWALIYMLALPPITAFLALNFTGSTTFTSVSGVRREIFTYIPYLAMMFGSGFLLMMILAFGQAIGGL